MYTKTFRMDAWNTNPSCIADATYNMRKVILNKYETIVSIQALFDLKWLAFNEVYMKILVVLYNIACNVLNTSY